MPPKIDREQNPNNEPAFENELHAILSAPLTPFNVDSYVNQALDNLVDLTNKVVRKHIANQGVVSHHTSQIEDEAFRAFELGSITSILDYVVTKGEQITDIETIISQAEVSPEVITPPELIAAMAIIAGDGSFERPSTIPRLKTLLFVLENKFDTDLKDSAQFRLSKGLLTGGMMRRESYYAVRTPQLGRTTLVCDEEGNATFIFDDQKLREARVSYEDLITLSKQDIKRLIDENPLLGTRIVYSDLFVPDVEAALSGEREVSVKPKRAESYLVPRLPAGFLSRNGLVKAWGVPLTRVQNAIDEARDVLGEVGIYNVGPGARPGYSPEQQEIIKANINTAPRVPEGHLSIVGMADLWGRDSTWLRARVDEIRDQLGEVFEYSFGSRIVEGYSPEQQDIIKAYIDLVPDAPDDYMTLNTLKKELHSNLSTIKKVLEALGDQLGEVGVYRRGHIITKFYSPEQQDIIRAMFVQAPPAPEGYKSRGGLEKEWGLSREVVQRAIDDIRINLGELQSYFFTKGSPATGYSPEQQKMIKEKLGIE